MVHAAVRAAQGLETWVRILEARQEIGRRMGLLGWWRGRNGRAEIARLDGWQKEWAAAVAAEDGGRIADLRRSLDGLGLTPDDMEIEMEMLEGLSELSAIAARLREGDLPVIETGHRVVGSDTCHFSAPASIPDDAAQPSGRMILTGNRAIFAGGGRATSIAWHKIAEILQTERDVLLVLHDRETAHRFRFNSFADALCGAALSRHLARRARPRTADR